jgi:hypothetical protein
VDVVSKYSAVKTYVPKTGLIVVKNTEPENSPSVG